MVTPETLQSSPLFLKNDRFKDPLPEVTFRAGQQTPQIGSHQTSRWKRGITSVVLPAIDVNKELIYRSREDALRKHRNIKRVCIETSDGVKLDTAAYVHDAEKNVPPEKKKWLLFFNGNSTAYEQNLLNLMQICNDLKINFYTGNYRGVGASEGRPEGSSDLVSDGQAMLSYLTDYCKTKPQNILLHGWSLGGAVALTVASNSWKKGKKVSLCHDRSFSKLEAVVANKLPCRSFFQFVTKTILSHYQWNFGDLHCLYRDFKGYKFFIYDPNDNVVDPESSMYFALGKKKGNRIRLSTNLKNLQNKAQAESLIAMSRSLIHLPTENGQYAHCIPINKASTDDYKQYLSFVKEALKIGNKSLN